MQNAAFSPPSVIETLAFETDAGLGQQARIGLIVLQTDQTIEHEFARLFRGEGVALYHARIPNAMEVSPETLRQMQADLPRTAELLPPSFGFDAIGYACTSGATMIGEACVDEMIRAVHPGARTSNPLTACKAALSALGLRRIALLTPYPPEVTLEMQANLRTAGFETVAVASFNQSDDFTVARISAQSILDAVATIGARDEVEGVFVSCTSLRALDVIAEAEARIGKPVIASNQVLAWHLMRLAGLDGVPEGAGRLFASG
ncbi:aspartate/glutamate racemase family protein [Ruegeria pomeroyi]|uniref:Aspartate/glutamate racemase family protein n=1 Tax=Ruegeria pomeroyi TaxID=89184 RepID=A0A9Q3WIA5_9RHOB|nr:Asp/Glu racemase [Ruegeria pomeroyi]MCE8536556.1 aspartate/glutamate racemase family protein [Ruegeria pomeroyi]